MSRFKICPLFPTHLRHSGSTGGKLPQAAWFSRCQPAAALRSGSLDPLAAWPGTDLSHTSGGTDGEPRAGVSWHIKNPCFFPGNDGLKDGFCLDILWRPSVFGIGLCSSGVWWCIGTRVCSRGFATYWWGYNLLPGQFARCTPHQA